MSESAELTIAESASDVSRRQNCIAHLFVHDGVQCIRRAELLKVEKSQRGSVIFNGTGKAKHADAYKHGLLRSLHFADTIEEFALAN